MSLHSLPRTLSRTLVPPIKCQGIKTKLVPFILQSIYWDGTGCWIEPFLGSGVVLFNVQPRRALVNDSNPHIIRFYRGIYEGEITPAAVSAYLTREGAALAEEGDAYYYEVRERFTRAGEPLGFLFLTRSCFNLADVAQRLPGGVAFSMWKANKYRVNPHLDLWQGMVERTVEHFYHVGPTEDLRNAMQEALMITPGYAAPLGGEESVELEQIALPFGEW